MPLEMRQLRAFVGVAEELSFVRAARRLHVAQPALSRTIHAIEAELGVQLIERTTRVVRLTPAGKVFLAQARNTLDQMEQTVQLTRLASAGATEELRIGYMDFAVYGPMPLFLRAFHRRHPSVKLNLQRRRSDDQSDDVAGQRLDVAFAIRHRFRPELDVFPLTCEPLVAILPARHRLAAKEKVSITDLADEPFVLGNRSGWQIFLPVVEAFCAGAGYAPNIAAEAHEGHTMCRLVAEGLGVSVYPECIARAAGEGVAVRPFVEDAPMIETFGLARRGGYSPVAAEFVDLLRRHCAGGHEPEARGSAARVTAPSASSSP